MNTNPSMKKYNGKMSVNHLKKFLKDNFASEDFEMFLSYSEIANPLSEKQAKKDIQNFFKRFRYYCGKNHTKQRYIWIMEKNEHSGKYYFRLFIKRGPGISQALLSTLWRKGGYILRQYSADSLRTVDDLAEKKRPTYRRWSISRNFR